MERLVYDELGHIALVLQAKGVVNFAATCRTNATIAKASAMARAEIIVASNSRQPDKFDSSSFKRNLRLIDAAERKKKHKANNKLLRLNDEIFYVADGSALSDVEVVSDSETEKEEE